MAERPSIVSINRDRPGLILRFCVVGAMATALYFSFATFLVHLAGMPDVPAAFLAYLIAGVVSYFGQRIFTFSANVSHRHSVPRFALVTASGMALAALITKLTLAAGGGSWLAVIGVCIVVPPVNFILFERIVFQSAQSRGGAA